MRRVRFGECDFSYEAHHSFLLEPERYFYPNIIMYLQGEIHAFNPHAVEGIEAEEALADWMVDEFVRETNYHVPAIDCDQFKEKREANEPMTVYVGPYKNLIHKHEVQSSDGGHGSPMMGFNRLKIFDGKTSMSTLNLYAFDM